MLYAAQHLATDFLTAIVFVAIYATTGNLPLAIGVTIVAAIAQIGFALVQGRKLDPMVWLSLFLAIAFGSASLIADDPRFVMVKPSIIHFAIGCVVAGCCATSATRVADMCPMMSSSRRATAGPSS
jgi:intracellular septation protein